jgi:hypothetical protein
MKKNILLALSLVFCFSSCSKDDDESSSSRLIGTWGIYKEVNITDNIIIEEYDAYNPENQTNFIEGGVFESYETDGNGNIVNTYQGTWEHLGATKYEVNLIFTFVIDIEFENDNEVRMKIPNLFGDDEEETKEEWGYYKRIK